MDCSRLLQGVGQLMCNQPLPLCAVRRILAFAEYDIVAGSVGEGIDGLRGFGRNTPGVDADISEVASEAVFHLGSDRIIEPLAARTEGIVNNCWNLSDAAVADMPPLDYGTASNFSLALFSAFLAFSFGGAAATTFFLDARGAGSKLGPRSCE
jgi:hypothetical protein